MKHSTVLSWSSGKDSAWALHVLRESEKYDVVGLLTTVSDEHQRVAMHGVRRTLLEKQARAANLPLQVVALPWPCSNEAYEEKMSQACRKLIADGVTHLAFGDLFLEDIRAYREQKLAGTGLNPVFPLWQKPTLALAREMMQSGMVAHLATVDPRQVPADLVGREWDEELLALLPDHVDACGENGEFHTFVSNGPMFTSEIAIEVGQSVERDGFWYADLLPR